METKGNDMDRIATAPHISEAIELVERRNRRIVEKVADGAFLTVREYGIYLRILEDM